MAADKDNFLTPGKATQQAKSTATDQAARSIMSAETAAREKKTAKLKALRLQQLADAPPAPTPAPKKKKS
jgi:hypothetical protein